jgi:deoxyribose-phosphate aldolase
MNSTITLREIARMIDHSLLHPTMTDADIRSGCELAREYGVATACVKPYSIPLAREVLAGSDVGICPVIGFPHGNSSTRIKVQEAIEAVREGGGEIDMVINVGKALGGDWAYVKKEIQEINSGVVKEGAVLKVIFENDFLQDNHVIKLCEICSEVGVAFVKTSTGYGFVKQENGMYSYNGATAHHLKLMRKHCPPSVQIKAAGGIRTLGDVLLARSLGATRIGATATVAIISDARKNGIGDSPVPVPALSSALSPGGY